MEQTSITKKLYLTLGFALLGAVLALAFPGEITYETFAAPVNALGQALRGLSLSGTGGNIAAWAIFSGSPMPMVTSFCTTFCHPPRTR